MKGPNKVEPSAVSEVFIKAYNLENTVRILGDLYLYITDVEAFNRLYVRDNATTWIWAATKNTLGFNIEFTFLSFYLGSKPLSMWISEIKY